MNSFRTLAVVLLLVFPAVAHAQINLAWNDCITQPSAAANIQYACDGSRNGNPYKLVASFISPFGLRQFVGAQMYLDIVLPVGHDDFADPLPDWWRLGLGECREGNLEFPANMSGIGTGTTGACQNPWLGAATGGGFLYTSNYEGNPNRARLLTGFARATEFRIIAGQQYLSGVFTLDTFGDVLNDDGMCPGCCQSMLITLEKIELYSTAGSIDGDLITLTNPATRKHVWWQEVPCDAATPTRRTTWGAVKATYR